MSDKILERAFAAVTDDLERMVAGYCKDGGPSDLRATILDKLVTAFRSAIREALQEKWVARAEFEPGNETGRHCRKCGRVFGDHAINHDFICRDCYVESSPPVTDEGDVVERLRGYVTASGGVDLRDGNPLLEACDLIERLVRERDVAHYFGRERTRLLDEAIANMKQAHEMVDAERQRADSALRDLEALRKENERMREALENAWAQELLMRVLLGLTPLHSVRACVEILYEQGREAFEKIRGEPCDYATEWINHRRAALSKDSTP